jgi:hypothetical protein
MGPYTFTEPIVAQILKDWFRRSGELFIELHRPHSGASGNFYILNNYSQYEDLMMKASPGSICSVLRDKQLPIRGFIDDDLIQRAFNLLADGDYYLIVEPCTYPQMICFLGDGKTHVELEQDLRELQGTDVWVGHDFAIPNEYWKDNSAEDALIIIKPK